LVESPGGFRLQPGFGDRSLRPEDDGDPVRALAAAFDLLDRLLADSAGDVGGVFADRRQRRRVGDVDVAAGAEHAVASSKPQPSSLRASQSSRAGERTWVS
jgi:hypothetical protein